MLKARIALLAAKTESSYGVDPTLTGDANAILAQNVRFSPLKQQHDERLPAMPWFGNKSKVVVAGWHEISFEVEIGGQGSADLAAGTAPHWGCLHKACAMSETLNAATNAIYAPISSSETSVYLKFFINGKVHIAAGCMGNVVASFVKGKRPVWQYRFIGLYVIPADSAILTPTFTAQTPLAMNNANTTPLTLYTYAAKVSQLTFDFGAKPIYRNVPNSEAIRIIDRKTVGSVKFESELVATKDWYTIMRAGTTGALAITHGTVAGNKVAIAAAAMQFETDDMDEEDGIMMESIPFNCAPSTAGNDEFSITCT